MTEPERRSQLADLEQNLMNPVVGASAILKQQDLRRV
jgi:hypothetical protein